MSNQTKDSIGREDTSQLSLTREKLKVINPRIVDDEILSQSPGHAFILSHAVNGRLSVANGIDGKQVTLGNGGLKNQVSVQKRRWLFNTDVLLRRRQTTSSITSSGADITLSVD